MLNIQDTIQVSNPISLDAFLANYYVVDDSIKIETVEEYLFRIVRPLRRKGVPVIWINESGWVSLNDFAGFQNTCTTTKYWFKDGILDEHFIEYLDADVPALKNAIIGDESFVTSITNIVNEFLSSTNTLEVIQAIVASTTFNIRDQSFEFDDISGVFNSSYVLDIESIYDYKILALILYSDAIISSIYLNNDSSDNTILYVTPYVETYTKYKYTLGIDPENTAECITGDFINLNVNFGSDTGTFIRGKLIYEVHTPLINEHFSYRTYSITITEPGTTIDIYVYGALYPTDIDYGDGSSDINMHPRTDGFSHLYSAVGTYIITIFAENSEIYYDLDFSTLTTLNIVNQTYFTIEHGSDTILNLLNSPTIYSIYITETPIYQIIGLNVCSKLRVFSIVDSNLTSDDLTNILDTLVYMNLPSLYHVRLNHVNGSVPSSESIDSFITKYPDCYFVYILD